MRNRRKVKIGDIYRVIATLPLICLVVLFVSCTQSKEVEVEDNPNVMTQRADSMVILTSKDGDRRYRFEAALVESYDKSKEPYNEFRKGVDVRTYNDSTGDLKSTLVANYAIYFKKRELWEAKGNVVATNEQGHKLETQQLFWNQVTGKIYSNIDSKLTQGDDVIVGVGFESDEDFVNWVFRRPRGRVTVEVGSDEQDNDSIGGREVSEQTGGIEPPYGEPMDLESEQDQHQKKRLNEEGISSRRGEIRRDATDKMVEIEPN